MYNYRIYTLVDITQTNVNRGSSNDLKRDQERNYQTLLQTLSLRTQPLNVTQPIMFQKGTILEDKINLGGMYVGEHALWTMDFSVEFEGIFENANGPTGLLLEDLNEVPIINGLEETARFILPCFFSYGACKNIEVLKNSKLVV